MLWLRIRTFLRKYIIPSRFCAPIPGDPIINLSWANANNIGDGQKVVSVEMLGVKDNRGLVGTVCRAKCKLEDGTEKVLFIKTSGSDARGHASVIAIRNWREARFLSSPLPGSLASLRRVAPQRVYLASASPCLGEYCIITDDAAASHKGSIGCNYACGNQVWGMKGPDGKDVVVPDSWRDASDGKETSASLAAVRGAYVRAAAMHAETWRDETLVRGSEASGWLRAAAWYRGEEKEYWCAALEATRKMWAMGRQRLLAMRDAGELNLSQRVLDLVTRSIEESSWEHLQAHLRDSKVPFCLAMGDFHASNMRVGPTEEDMLWFDWSEVGPWEPTMDLAQFYVSDIKAELGNAERGKALVRLYHETLTGGKDSKVSASEYPFEQCYEDWCRSGCERWIWMFALLSCFPLPAAALQYFNDQLHAFATDHAKEKFYRLKAIALLPVG